MGFFPYFSPPYPWAVDELQRREDHLISTTFRNPWATLISSALVVKASPNDTTETDEQKRIERIHNIINNPGNDAYSGCIISNNINNLDLSYSPNQTIVGIDFNGNPIKVIGESGRKISTPIVESIDVDTDGANNTLKTAKVTVTCFSLKQLEMFEMFFMKPGMNVIVEWGDNSLLMYDKFQLIGDSAQKPTSPNSPITLGDFFNKSGGIKNTSIYKRPEEAMVINQDGNTNYDMFCDNFASYFRSDSDALAKYLNRIERSKGSYDLVAGKVLDYSFSVNENGTYTANFDISQGNQMTQWLPKNARKNGTKSSEKTPGIEISDKDAIIRQIAVDFDLNEDIFKNMLKKHPEKNGNWMDDWFNFIKINKEQKDTVASSKAYISLRFILAILANYGIKSPGSQDLDDYFFSLKIQKWLDGKEEKYIIPCISSKYMFSSSEEVIYPLTSPPTFEAPAYDKDKKGNRKLKNPNSENKITIKPESQKKDIKIGPYDFHINSQKLDHIASQLEGKIKINKQSLPVINNKKEDGLRIGNALNIFLNYDMVLKHWRRAYTRKDFLEEVLNMCNKNSYGLFRLVYGNMGECGFPISGPTILDIKFKGTEDPKKNEVVYRFKPTTIKSIVKQFSFNFEMSNLVAGRTLFNSSKFLEEALKAKKEKQIGPTQPNTQNSKDEKLPLPPGAYKSVDNSTFGNADGYYSINKVELKVLQKKLERAQELEKLGGGVKEKGDQDENTESTTEVEDLKEVIKNRSINFLIDETQKSQKRVMIFKDNALIQEAISGDPTKKRLPTVSPITVTITIDGFSGFNCGQYFYLDGVPEIYNQLGVFQITNTKHNISKDGWTTTLEADYHIVNKK